MKIMNEKKYIEDFKSLKPAPLERIPRQDDVKSIPRELVPVKVKKETSLINNQLSEGVKVMEPLRSSKTLWGFGIALFIYVLQSVLAAANIASPDNILVKTAVEIVIAVAGFFGVYGIRDALRKIGQQL